MALPGSRFGPVMGTIVLLVGSLAGSLVGQQAPPVADTTVAAGTFFGQEPPTGAPVVFGPDTLFFLYQSFGSVSALDRAAAIPGRIRKAALRVRAGIDTVTVVEVGDQVGILAGDLVLLGVLPGDVLDTTESQVEVATRYAEQIKDVIVQGSFRERMRRVGVGLVLTMAATLLLLVLRVLLIKGLDRVGLWIEMLRGSSRLPTLRIQKLEVLSADRIADAFRIGLKAIRLAALLVLFYFYIVAVLGLFPWTRAVSTQILGYVLDPLGAVGRAILAYLPDLFFLAIIALVTRYLLRGVHAIFNAIETGHVEFPEFDRDWAMPTYKLARFLVMAFALVVMWPYLPGSGSDAFKGVSLFVGLVFSLGSTGAVANLMAGTLLTYTRAFQVGDRIRIGDTTGDVVARTLMVTRLRTITNVEVTIPNNMVMSSAVLNFSTNARRGGILIQTTITIGYDVPWRRVQELLLRAAGAVDAIASDPPPFVLQTGLNDYYPEYQLNGYISNPQGMLRIQSDLNGKIQDVFAEGGVEITSPAFTSIRDGNPSTIPAPHTPPHAPVFRFQAVPPGEGA